MASSRLAVTEVPDSTSVSLLNRVLARDPEAWRKLARLYCPLVYGWARQRGLQDADSADAVQEVFRTVAGRIGSFHKDRPGDSFRGWLWTITRNKLGDYFRRVAARPQAAGASDAAERFLQLPETPPDRSASGHDLQAGLIRRTLELVRPEFEDKTWQAFWRATIEGHPAADIGRDLGMTPRAVRQAKYRVPQRLRRELADLGE